MYKKINLFLIVFFLFLSILFSASILAAEYESEAWSQNWNTGTQYMVQFKVEDPSHDAISVEIAGPGIEVLSLDYDVNENNWNSWWNSKSLDFGGSPPTPPLEYTFTIVDSLGTTIETDTVERFVEVSATDLSPIETVTGPLVVFSWTGVELGYSHTYAVELNDAESTRIWNVYGLVDTSVNYDGPALTSGAEYSYDVVVVDEYGNQSFAGGSFIYQTGESEWLFMVYMAGDNDLEDDLIGDFLEMAEVGSSDTVNLVVQLDRIDGGYSGYGNWTDARRGLVVKNSEPHTSWGESIGEVDMGDTQTLVNFVEWAVSNYGAPNIALIFSNHGDGWRSRIEELRSLLAAKSSELSLSERDNIIREIGILESKLESEEGLLKAVCSDDTDEDVLYTNEVGEALNYLYVYGAAGYGIDINLVGFDACLMGMLEVAHEIKGYVAYGNSVMVASEKSEPLAGWPYNTILSDLTDSPIMDVYNLAETIVNRYGEYYVGSIYGDQTLSAVNLSAYAVERAEAPPGGVNVLSAAVSNFADTVITQNTDWDVIYEAKQQAGYYSYSYYRDLRGFMEGVVLHARNEAIRTAAFSVIVALDSCIVANHSSFADGGNGLSIYFADWQGTVDADYNAATLLFAADTSWDEFLAAYVGAPLVGEQPESYEYSREVPASQYVMVSSPVTPSNSDPVVNLQDDLGNYDKTVWRLFRWNSLSAIYREYPFYGQEVIPGKGYWLISKDAKNIDIYGVPEDTTFPFCIPLYPGWNQIGNPFDFDIDWDYVYVLQLKPPYAYYYVTSSENILTYKTLWRYSNGGYSAAATMVSGEGYWVKNLTADWVYLVVIPAESQLEKENIVLLESLLTGFGSSEESPPAPPDSNGDEVSESSDGGSGGGSGCFIATASFGSPMAGEVDILRNFRDKYLLSNPIGQLFVSTYYRYSPKVADFIAKHNFLKVLVRSTLYPLVKGCGVLDETPYRSE